MKYVVSTISLSLFLVSCGGVSKLSLKEAEQVTLNFQGEYFVPPPRGIDRLVKNINEANEGYFCDQCEDLDVEHPDLAERLNNLSHMAARSMFMGNTRLAKEYFKRGNDLFKTLDFETGMAIRLFLRSAIVATQIGDYSEVSAFANKALEMINNRSFPFKGGEIVAYTLLAENHAVAGNAELAEEAANNAEYVYDSINFEHILERSLPLVPYWEMRMPMQRRLMEK